VKAYNNLNSLLYFELKNISENGNFAESRGSNQKEVLFRSFSLDDPTDLQIAFPSRKFNVVYAITEWLWYLSKDSRVHNIGKLAKIWDMIKSSGGTVESNYGIYLFDNIPTKPSQWQWVINELTNDRDSRRATIPINEPHHKFMNNLDIPCTQYIQFFIRDNKLHLGVSMRSNDIIFGLCNDIFTFCLFHQLMLNELRHAGYSQLQLGKYYHHAGSLHLYERHYEMADNILTEKIVENNSKKVELLDFVTYNYIKANQLYLPSEELSKEEIKLFVDGNKNKIFKEVV
jgi:thymidylate synthase